MEREGKVNISLLNGVDGNEVILREGKAPDMLPIKPPIQLRIIGNAGSVSRFLRERSVKWIENIDRCHVIVDRDNAKLTLHINEDDPYTYGKVESVVKYSKEYIDLGVNSGKLWTPAELGIFFRMNRRLFIDKSTNMEVVSNLMNFTAAVNNQINRSIHENGSNSNEFSQVVNSSLPPAVSLKMSIIKGTPQEEIVVETFAHVDGREVKFCLFSPGAAEIKEDLVNRFLDDEIAEIKDVTPSIVIIEV